MIFSWLHSERRVVAAAVTLKTTVSLFVPVVLLSPALFTGLSSALLSTLVSVSLSPLRHLCDSNGTPVGLRLVSLSDGNKRG